MLRRLPSLQQTILPLMPDDNQFDPLAGILTPQTLALQRQAQMQQMYQQAGNARNGQQFLARALGLTAAQGISGAMGPPNTAVDQMAQQNQNILSSPGYAVNRRFVRGSRSQARCSRQPSNTSGPTAGCRTVLDRRADCAGARHPHEATASAYSARAGESWNAGRQGSRGQSRHLSQPVDFNGKGGTRTLDPGIMSAVL
jgi:hypothetical protein